MKKKSPSQSAFLNRRVLIGLAVFLSGVCLALAGLGTLVQCVAPIQAAAQRSLGKSPAATKSSSHSYGTRCRRARRAVFASRQRRPVPLHDPIRRERDASEADPRPRASVSRPTRRKRRQLRTEVMREQTGHIPGHDSSAGPRIECVALFFSDAIAVSPRA